MRTHIERGRTKAPPQKNHFLSRVGLIARNVGIVCKAACYTIRVGVPAVIALWRMRERDIAERRAFIWNVASRVWTPRLLKMAHVRLVVSGERDYLERGGYILAANHTSMLEVFALVSLIPNGTVVAKQEASRWPIIGQALHWSGQVIVNRTNHRDAMSALRAHVPSKDHNILMYPEGTRTRTGELGQFKHGAATFSEKHSMPIVPVAMLGGFEALPKGSPLRLARESILEVVFGKPMHRAREESIPDFTNRVREHIAAVLASRRSTPS